MNEAHTSLEEHTEEVSAEAFTSYVGMREQKRQEEMQRDIQTRMGTPLYSRHAMECWWWYSSPSFNSDINL